MNLKLKLMVDNGGVGGSEEDECGRDPLGATGPRARPPALRLRLGQQAAESLARWWHFRGGNLD